MNEIARPSVTAYPHADVLHIGYPKAASSFLQRYLESHPDVTTDQNQVADLLLSPSSADACVTVGPSCPGKTHVSREESVAESVCVVGELENWRRYIYVPGAWDRVKDDIVLDPGEAASRLHKVYPRARVLILIREQVDWLQSAYKYVMSQLPLMQRSFADYCTTPSGIALLQAGHYDRTIGAYVDVFGRHSVRVLRFEDLVSTPERFADELCAFIGVSPRPIPQRRENETNTQLARIQRLLPVVDRLPRSIKSTLRPHAIRMLPGGRRPILSRYDIRVLRSIYAPSNQRTEKLIGHLGRVS